MGSIIESNAVTTAIVLCSRFSDLGTTKLCIKTDQIREHQKGGGRGEIGGIVLVYCVL